MAESKTLRLLVHRLRSGEVAAAVLIRTWAGREAWDRRLAPPRALGTPPDRPAPIDPRLWILLWTTWALAGLDPAILDDAVRRAGSPRGAEGGSAERPIPN